MEFLFTSYFSFEVTECVSQIWVPKQDTYAYPTQLCSIFVRNLQDHAKTTMFIRLYNMSLIQKH